MGNCLIPTIPQMWGCIACKFIEANYILFPEERHRLLRLCHPPMRSSFGAVSGTAIAYPQRKDPYRKYYKNGSNYRSIAVEGAGPQLHVGIQMLAMLFRALSVLDRELRTAAQAAKAQDAFLPGPDRASVHDIYRRGGAPAGAEAASGSAVLHLEMAGPVGSRAGIF